METSLSLLVGFTEWLLRSSCQTSVVIGLVVLAQWLFQKRLSPRWRNGLWLLVLVRLMLPVLPGSPFSIFNYTARVGGLGTGTASFREPLAERGAPSAPPSVAAPGASPVVPAARSSKSPAASLADPTTAGTPRGPRQIPAGRAPRNQAPSLDQNSSGEGAVPEAVADPTKHWSWPVVFSLLWLGGALWLMARIIWFPVRLNAELAQHETATGPAVFEVLEQSKRLMGLSKVLPIVQSRAVKSPALMGFIRPWLLLPDGMVEGFTPQELCFVFLHELAHLKRRDIAVNWLMTLLQILHWFNPLVWFAFSRMRADRELACDELALSFAQAEEKKSYGQAIIKLLEGFTRPAVVPSLVGILEDKNQMKRRINMIAQFNKGSRGTVLAGLLFASLGLITLTDAETGGDKSSGKPGDRPSVDITMRRVWTGPKVDQSGRISRDGRLLSYTDWETGDLAIHDLVTGADRRLTNKGSWQESSAFVETSVISPDGKQVAYAWSDGMGTYQLRLMPIAGEKPRILYQGESSARISLRDWSPNNQYLLASIRLKPNRYQIGLISVADGSLRVLKDSKAGNLFFSPDGQFVTYDALPPGELNRSDIWLLKIDGASQIPLVQHRADDVLLGWSPDGQWILFASDRGGTMDAWKLRVEKGQPQGEPVLVKSNLGQAGPLGVTGDGSFFYSVKETSEDVFVVALDAATGKLKGKPERVPDRYLGHNSSPAWSPDGKNLAYRSKRGNSWFLCLHSMETGEQRELPLALSFVAFPDWSADGKHLYVHGRDRENRSDSFQLDVQTGEVAAMKLFPLIPLRGSQGKTALNQEGLKEKQILTKDLQTRKERNVYTFPDGSEYPTGYRWVLSPDASQLALDCGKNNMTLNILRVVSIADGTARDLVQTTNKISAFAWMPDSRELLCSISNELCMVQLEGGSPRKLGFALAVNEVSVHPDGERIAVSSGGQESQVWVMDNLFPKSAKVQTADAETGRSK